MEVSIIAGNTAAESSVRVRGSVFHVITDDERKIFDITDSPLKDAVGKYHGKRPNDAYVRSSTPWGDLYKTYNWPQVTMNLEVKSSKVVGLKMEPVAVASRSFVNNTNAEATFSADLAESITETTENNWSTTHGFTVGRSMSYGIQFQGLNLGGETSMSYSAEFGKGGSQSKAVSISSSAGVQIVLRPKEKAVATFTANRGTLDIEIVYQATLTGSTAVNYNPKYNNHHFWCLNINSVLSAAGKKRTFEITEKIKIGYYSSGTVEVTKS